MRDGGRGERSFPYREPTTIIETNKAFSRPRGFSDSVGGAAKRIARIDFGLRVDAAVTCRANNQVENFRDAGTGGVRSRECESFLVHPIG